MSKPDRTICLSMIVKNEAHVINRCLSSVRPLIDHWVIVDTGSTDGTQDIIRTAMADIPGTLVERPWVDFSTNRNEALKLARPHAHYSLIIDADDQLIVPADFQMPKLRKAGYMLTIIDQNTKYWRIQLVNNKYYWYYRGVLHEFLKCQDDPETPVLPLSVRRGVDGGRHYGGKSEWRDLAVLEQALTVETDPAMIARYTFYLARSYRDVGEDLKALEYYLKRAELGYWEEEIYISLLNAARIMETLDAPEDSVFTLYDHMISVRPLRAEGLHSATEYCRRRGNFVRGYYYGQAGLNLEIPSEGIAVIPWIYTYGLREEFSIHAYHTGQYRTCLSTCLEILKQSGVPADVLSRTGDLARKALVKLVDPAWGSRQSAYSFAFSPAWQL